MAGNSTDQNILRTILMNKCQTISTNSKNSKPQRVEIIRYQEWIG